MVATTAAVAARPNPLPGYPKLPRMETCTGALATCAQRTERHIVEMPRGFNSSHARSASKSATTLVPAARSALWFRELHAGYRSAQFVHAAAGLVSATQLLAAETLELQLANRRAEAPDAPGVDQSQAPRRLALWVLAHEDAAGLGTQGQQKLDALAHWARSRTDKGVPLATRVRMSIATGTDKDCVLARITAEGADAQAMDLGRVPSGSCRAAWAVALRWSDAVGAMHSSIYTWRHSAVDTNAHLEQLQRAVCSLMAQYDLHVCAGATLAVPGPVPFNAWTTHSAAVDAEFVARLETAPSVTLSPAAAASDAPPLEFTGVFVRVCEKKRGDDGVAHPSAFHGVLLSFGTHKQAAADFANAADPAIACPCGPVEESMGLHLCAVQAQESALATSVSLYAHLGRFGEPIHAPYSHVLCESAAVRPVDQALLGTWDVRPCDKSSIIPSDATLQEPFRQHFARASALYLSLGTPPPPSGASGASGATRLQALSSGEELDAMVARLPRAPAVNNPQAERDDLLIRLAFHVDMRSRRTTIGDAYGYLFDAGAPKPMMATMLSAMGQLGVRASLNDMFQLTARAVRASGELTPQMALENTRLKRLADVCLEAIAAERGPTKCPRPAPQPLGATEHVRRMLSSLGLKKGREAALVPGMNDASISAAVAVVVETLAHFAHGSPLAAADAHHLVDKAFVPCRDAVASGKGGGSDGGAALSEWMQTTDHAVARAASVAVLRNGITNTPVFLVTARRGVGAVTVQRVAITPLLLPSSFDAMIAAPRACVLLLLHADADAFRCKLTGTALIKPTTA